MKEICDLPHGYVLAWAEGKGPRGMHLIAIVRPDGTLANISLAPPALFPSTWIRPALYQAIHADLKLLGKEID